MCKRYSRRAISFIELLFGLGVLLLLIAILLPSLARARELSKRTVCAANMGGTGKGFAMYAVANNDDFPIPAHQVQKEAGPAGQVTYVRMIGAQRGSAEKPEAGETTPESTKLSTTRAFWYLIRSGASSPKSFVCPSSADRSNDDDNPAAYWDFGTGDQLEEGMGKQDPRANWLQISYGYQVPFGKLGRPNGDMDMDVAIAADKGPYGAFLDAGYGREPAAPTLDKQASPGEWRPWNSPNHGGLGDGEGQNAMFADAHVQFTNKPLIGPKHENIYTQWSAADADDDGRSQGKPPTAEGREVPLAETDSLIYP